MDRWLLRKMGKGNAVLVETWAIKIGLDFAWDMKINKLILELLEIGRSPFGEGNGVANVLANLVHILYFGISRWSSPLPECISVVKDDAKGLWLPRSFVG
ncbi:ribonuclease H [Senna tora]|uniref:Ribonuclease H n=1 Tax=Senna tora TaxID=362788 RepID=A0A834W9A8_9FABA|nr:ribonuclease H [Senna tora]